MGAVQLRISDQIQQVEIKEFKNQRVVTFKDIDELHQRPEGTARQTFHRHKDKFIEGMDYFVCDTYEAESIGVTAPNGLTLLTESGYLMITKPFSDDLAWDVQRQLVNYYFKTKPEMNPMSIEDILITALQGMKQIRDEAAQLKIAQSESAQEVRRLAVVVDNEVWLTDNQKAQLQEAVKYRCGWLKRQGYQASFQAMYSALKTHFTVPKYDKIKRKDFDHAMDYIRGWYPPKR